MQSFLLCVDRHVHAWLTGPATRNNPGSKEIKRTVLVDLRKLGVLPTAIYDPNATKHPVSLVRCPTEAQGKLGQLTAIDSHSGREATGRWT
jgi:hypothetical protein